MKIYISMLRGINVSGQKKILMTDLKSLYESLSFQNVKTYIQSGNVIFKTDSNLNVKELEKRLEQEIYNQYKFEVPVIIRNIDELKNIINFNPFLETVTVNTEKLYITFLSEKPKKEYLEAITNIDYSPDKFIINDNTVFLYCHNNYGETKLSNKFFENKLKVSATTRNWKTVNKLLELSN